MTDEPNVIRIRHRERAAQRDLGVTSNDVIEVIRLVYEQGRPDDFPEWPEFLRDARRNPRLWAQYFLDPDGDFSSFGEDAAKVQAVMRVAAVVFEPPGINSWTRVAAYTEPCHRVPPLKVGPDQVSGFDPFAAEVGTKPKPA